MAWKWHKCQERWALGKCKLTDWRVYLLYTSLCGNCCWSTLTAEKDITIETQKECYHYIRTATAHELDDCTSSSELDIPPLHVTPQKAFLSMLWMLWSHRWHSRYNIRWTGRGWQEPRFPHPYTWHLTQMQSRKVKRRISYQMVQVQGLLILHKSFSCQTFFYT